MSMIFVDEAAFFPDDLWCDLCQEEPYTSISADGVAACENCAAKVLDGISESQGAIMVGPNREQRRAMQRQQRLHNNGSSRW